MLKKPFEIPITIRKLEALLRRLPANYPCRTKIEDELARKKAGYRGEKSIEYYLNHFPDKEYLFFYNLRLPQDETYYFQMDILLLTSRYLIIFEVKNMSGTLCFDQTYHQLIRTIGSKEEAFPDPILQVNRQQSHLQQWLASNHFSNIPIYSFVVISNPAAYIKSIPSYSETVIKKVIHAALLPEKIEAIDRLKHDDISSKELNKLTRVLLKQNTPHNKDVLSQFEIQSSKLLTGVACPKCFKLPMIRIHGCWKCSECRKFSKDAHTQALVDYALLLSNSISNNDVCSFLHLSNPSIATRILKQQKLQYTGSYRRRIYHLPPPK